MGILKKNKKVLLFLGGAFLLRLFLAPYGTLWLDMNTWIGWSSRLVKVGFSRFYNLWSDYLPGYLYILWFLGQIKAFFPVLPNEALFKLPSILADLATGYLIFLLVKNLVGRKTAFLASALYVFNPAIFANSTLWGQADSFSTLLVVFSFYFLWQKRYLLSSGFLSFACFTKPQSLIFIPFVFLPILKKRKISNLISSFSVFGLIFIFVFLPFAFGQNLIAFIWERFKTTFSQYPYASVNAFNLWGVLGKMWAEDSDLWQGVPFQWWGFLFFGVIVTGLFTFLWKDWKESKKNYLRLASVFALVAFAAFLFLTRVHERHHFSVFAFLALVASAKPPLWIAYLFLSVTYLLNLYYSFIWINQNFRAVFSSAQIGLIAFLNLALFGFIFCQFLKNEKVK